MLKSVRRVLLLLVAIVLCCVNVNAQQLDTTPLINKLKGCYNYLPGENFKG